MAPLPLRTSPPLRVALAALAAAGVSTYSDRADACFDPDADGPSRTIACVTSLNAGLTTAVFIPVDISYGLERKWVPFGWALPQLLLGSFGTMGGGIATMVVAGVDDDTRYRAADIGWGAGLVALGGIHGAIATWSLERYDPVNDSLPAPQVAVAPTLGGAMVTASFATW